jgi:hypothetical protein
MRDAKRGSKRMTALRRRRRASISASSALSEFGALIAAIARVPCFAWCADASTQCGSSTRHSSSECA